MVEYVCVPFCLGFVVASVKHYTFLSENCHRSPTCPQCRDECDISFIKRLYLDFAPEEPTPSTSRAAAELDARKMELQRALRMDGETEETIRQLLEQIDQESFRTEEYTNQLGDFDAQSEEISKLKSQIEDSSEDYKNFIATIDDLNEKIAVSDAALQDEKRLNHARQVELNEFAIKLQSIEDTLIATQTQRDRAEQKAYQSESQKLQSEHRITVLQTECENTAGELNWCRLQLESTNHDLEELKKLYREQKAKGDRLWMKVHTLIGDCVPNKNLLIDQMLKQMNGGKVYARNGDSKAIAPFCGDIKNWRFMIVPILDKFSFGFM